MACGTDPGVWSLGSGKGGGAAKDVPGRKARGGKPATTWEQPCGAMRAAKTHLAPLLGSHVVARLAARGSALILRFAYRARVSALDQVDGIERAVDRVIAPKEEAGKRHHLAATIGQERREETGRRPVK